MQRALLGDAGPAAPVLLIIIILALQTAALANDAAVSILYYESIRLAAVPETNRQTAVTTNDPASLSFDAYGRRFELQIDDTRVVRGSGLIRLSGRLAGLPDSWFRLIRHDEELSGIIADGVDTYLVEPRRRVADLLIDVPADNAPVNIIYRLADTLMPQGLLACATPHDAATIDEPIDGQSAFNKLGAELQNASGNASLAGNLRLRLGIVADESFVKHNLAKSENEVTLIFNTVQGIYANELGIELEIDDVFLVTPDVINPFSDTAVAPDLLGELADWRSANHTNLGLTHLLTRRNLISAKGGTSLAGLSYFGQAGRSGICNPTTGASLSSDVSGLTALIIAHEMGHNFGAPHDGDGACASEPDSGFIMGSRISRQTEQTFSRCSIRQMKKVIAAASCLNPAAQSLPATSINQSGGGGSALGWLSIPGLIASLFLRRRRHKVPV